MDIIIIISFMNKRDSIYSLLIHVGTKKCSSGSSV